MSEPVTKSIGITYTENGALLQEATAQPKHGRVPLWVFKLFLVLVVPINCAQLIPDLRAGNQTGVWIDIVFFVSFFWVFWFIGVFPNKKGELRRYQKAYRQTTGRDESQASCEFNDGGLLIVASEGVTTHLPWPSVSRVVEHPLGLVFYTGPKTFRWYPKRYFVAPFHYDALIDLVQAKVPSFERLHDSI